MGYVPVADSAIVHRFRQVGIAILLAANAACASTGVTPYGGGATVGATGPAVVANARTHAGVAYRAGGASPSGFDCSGFVQYLFGQVGLPLPRTAEAQFDLGRSVRARDLAPGDLVFFRIDGRRISHVGIATGDGGFIHAPNARSHVRVDRLDLPYWARRFAGARRLLDSTS